MSYDVFMLTYEEPEGDENFEALRELCPRAQRIDGIKGILNAHKACADTSQTELFFVVDGDNQVLDHFKFDYQAEEQDRDAIHVWRCKNAVNDLIYGYGAIKLFPKTHVLEKANMPVDMSTSLTPKYKIIHELASITCFNTDPYNTWKSAFRECVKLSSGLIKNQKQDETIERLNVWCQKGGDRVYGDWCLRGAQMGREYGEKYRDQPEKIAKINDFDWLKTEFENLANT